LPVTLGAPSNKHYIMSYRQVLKPGNTYSVDEQHMRAQLRDIKETGFSGTTIYDGPEPEAVERAYRLRKEEGLVEHTIILASHSYHKRLDELPKLVERVRAWC